MRRMLVLLAGALALMVGAVGPAGAITFGQVDGNAHPNVGALVAEFDGTKSAICSGTLVSPTVFLTAGHCTVGLERVWVTFDTRIDPADAGSANLLAGTAYTHPQHGGPQLSEAYDVGVVVLDRSVRRITPATLPRAGLLASMGKPQLRKASFVTVGYGLAREVKTGGPHSLFDDGQRRYTTQSFSNLLPAWLDLSMNPSIGDGGTCYGDSGGPHFLGTTVVSVTVTGDTYCRSTDKTYRVDTPTARDFLRQFVTLP